MKKLFILTGDWNHEITAVLMNPEAVRNSRGADYIETWELNSQGVYKRVSTMSKGRFIAKLDGRTLDLRLCNKRKYTHNGVSYAISRTNYCNQIAVDNDVEPKEVTIWLLEDDYDSVISGETPLADIVREIDLEDDQICLGSDTRTHANYSAINII